ncbi:SDR family NAD(P)-dependent oxidoreductase [Sciscionella sediminilitoris]|uniref:SDR family NAD(P)-dependent oxidoreductase n=1 Tax=Sciscionella sediminilitoris TaxID=1445613 RepID=UPI0004DF19BD|nr:SDR family oxidoreductase [Sciscionella sp. SE31]
MTRTAVVVGAAGGIGSACVRRLAADGYRVVAVDADERVRELPDCRPVHGDCTAAEVLDEAFADPVDVLVHGVYHWVRAPLEELRREDWLRVLDVGLLSAWEAAVRLAKGGRAASIVLIGSVQANRAVAGAAPYAASKAGLASLARAAAVEWGPRGIRCNVVEPGAVEIPVSAEHLAKPEIRGPMLDAQPLRRLCVPDEIAGVVAFLAGSDSAFVNGETIAVNGGTTALLPGELPRYS